MKVIVDRNNIKRFYHIDLFKFDARNLLIVYLDVPRVQKGPLEHLGEPRKKKKQERGL